MSRITLNRNLALPNSHRSFNERVDFIVGYYVGNAFHICCTLDNWNAALDRWSYYQEQYPDKQINIIENRTQLIYLV